MRALLCGLGSVALLAACSNSGLDLDFPPEPTAGVVMSVYLDRDGSRTPTALDTVYVGARVALMQKGTNDTVQTVITGNNGTASFLNLKLGEYRLTVVPSSLGDSIELSGIDRSEVRLEAATGVDTVTARLAYPEVTIRQARNLPIGRRVFVRGMILVGVQQFRDTTSHLSDSSGAIRMTRVSLRGGLTGNNPGDSVSVLGLTSTRLGQPTLDLAVVARFATRPPPIALQVTTGEAATAKTGTLDAGLVQVTATIVDTLTISPDFRVNVTDQSGTLAVVLDANLNFFRPAFSPGRGIQARGVLVPDGIGGWRLKPRDPSDVILF